MAGTNLFAAGDLFADKLRDIASLWNEAAHHPVAVFIAATSGARYF
jgi:hypothetical protein